MCIFQSSNVRCRYFQIFQVLIKISTTILYLVYMCIMTILIFWGVFVVPFKQCVFSNSAILTSPHMFIDNFRKTEASPFYEFTCQVSRLVASISWLFSLAVSRPVTLSPCLPLYRVLRHSINITAQRNSRNC